MAEIRPKAETESVSVVHYLLSEILNEVPIVSIVQMGVLGVEVL